MALTGFQSATGCSQPGSVCRGTKALDMKVSGKIAVKATCCPTSTVGTSMPSQTPTQMLVVGHDGDDARQLLDDVAGHDLRRIDARDLDRGL